MSEQANVNGRFQSVPIEDRFWKKVDKTGDCWLWTSSKNAAGYGTVYYQGSAQCAHRVSYTLSFGAISPKYVIDHLCRNHSCVNPDHLEAVPHEENVRRGLTSALKHLRVTALSHTNKDTNHER